MKTIILLFFTILFGCGILKAQIPLKLKKTEIKRSVEDSLLAEFQNTVYYTFYNPSYISTTTATFTVLKIDINHQGLIESINFSDGADSSFVKAWINRKNGTMINGH